MLFSSLPFALPGWVPVFLQRGFKASGCAQEVLQGRDFSQPALGGEAAPRLPKPPRTLADLCLLQLPFLAPGRLSHVPCCHRLPWVTWCKSPGWARPRCSAVGFWEQRDFGVVQSTQRAGSGPGWEFLGSGIYLFFNSLAGNKSPARGGKLQLARGKPASSLLGRGSKINNRSDSPKKKNTLVCLVVISGEITGT